MKEPIFDRELVPLYCSEQDIRDGTNTQFWKDAMAQLESWLVSIRDELEDPANMLLPKTLNRLGGNAEAIRRVLLLSEQMTDAVQHKIKEM